MINPEAPFEIPEVLNKMIEERLAHWGLELKNDQFLASQIKRLSDFYIQNPKAETPDFTTAKNENSNWAEIASLVYFFPLNYLRNLKVFQEADRLNFLDGLEDLIEFGSGLAPSSWSVKTVENDRSQQNNERLKNFHWIEKLSGAETYAALFEKKFQQSVKLHRQSPENFSTTFRLEKTLAVFSYSLTELAALPAWAEQCEALVILEPSTQQDGRRLQELRSELIHKGFSIWGPCLHEETCPLLKHSKKDWCHDRLLFQRPLWLEKIERHLKWENKSLTFSYLLARKTPPPWKGRSMNRTARVIGDTLFEKGKTRQLICKNQERLFFSWLNKSSLAPHLARGSLVSWTQDEVKSNEIRPTDRVKYLQNPEQK